MNDLYKQRKDDVTMLRVTLTQSSFPRLEYDVSKWENSRVRDNVDGLTRPFTFLLTATEVQKFKNDRFN